MSVQILPQIQVYLTQYGMTSCLILGNIGNIIIIYYFKKQYQNACSIYLLIAALMNIIFLSFNVPLFLYTNNNIDPTTQSLIFCKIRLFLPHVVGQIARYSIALACIDRFVFTGHYVRLRCLSRPKIAYILIFITTILLTLASIHILILTTITNGRCGPLAPYSIYYTSYIIIFVSIIPPVIMAVFGYLAYRYIRLLHMRVQPVRNLVHLYHNKTTTHRRDRELLTMVLAEVFVYVITMTIYPIILLEVIITNNMNVQKSGDYIIIENFLTYIGTFIGYMNNAAPFYIYLIVSKAFRKRVMKVLKCSRNQRVRQEPVVFTTRQLKETKQKRQEDIVN